MTFTPICLLVFTAFVIVGFHAVTRTEFILYFLGYNGSYERQKLNQIQERIDTVLELLQYTDFTVPDELVDIHTDTEEILKRYSLFGDLQQLMTGEDGEKIQIPKKNKVKDFLSKPFSECPVCMASVWGIGVQLLHYKGQLYIEFFGVPVFFVLLSCLAIAGMVYTIQILAK